MIDKNIEGQIEEIVKILKNSQRLFFVTGAGISAESGVPTYRGIGGLYNQGETEEGLPIETVLSGEMFFQRPEITWKYLSQIEKATRGASFHRAHQILAEMESHFDTVLVLTQNVDGFHQAAGSKNVIDIHGNFRELLCVACRHREQVQNYEGLEIPPRCEICGGFRRPDVVLFGELLPPEKLRMLQEQLPKKFDVYFSIGTSSFFPYIAGPILSAASEQYPTIEINPGTSGISDEVRFKITLGAAEALEAIWQKYQNQ